MDDVGIAQYLYNIKNLRWTHQYFICLNLSFFFFFWVEHHLFRYNNTKVRIIVVMLSHILSYCSKIIEIMIGLAFRRQMRRT